MHMFLCDPFNTIGAIMQYIFPKNFWQYFEHQNPKFYLKIIIYL